ncbi:MAG: hypothetical protein PHS57_09330 [Alphaproteobacteria bacterium]|nr:hypothetical protein [Alphaproteobacteria bacterium]
MQKTFSLPDQWPQTGLGDYKDVVTSAASLWDKSLSWGFCNTSAFSPNASEQEDLIGRLLQRMLKQNSFWVDAGMPRPNPAYDRNLVEPPSTALRRLISSGHVQLSENGSKMAMAPKLMGSLMDRLPEEITAPFLEKAPSPPSGNPASENVPSLRYP